MAGALVASVIAVSTTVASAHAPLRGTSPTANQNLKSPPSSVQLLAGEQEIGNGPDDYVRVYDAGGRDHASASSAVTQGNNSLVTAPVGSMGTGWYLVHWNVASDDGHMMGGDGGSWWAFGVNGPTARSATRTFTFRNAAAPAGIAKSFKVKMNGLRTGSRTLTSELKWGTVVGATWTVVDSPIDQFDGAAIKWGVTCRKSVCSSSGIVPIVANWRVELQVRARTKSGTVTSVWTTTVVPG